MKITTTLLVAPLISLLMIPVVQASPLMGLQRLLGIGGIDVTTQQNDSRGYGNYYGYGPYGGSSSLDFTTVSQLKSLSDGNMGKKMQKKIKQAHKKYGE